MTENFQKLKLRKFRISLKYLIFDFLTMAMHRLASPSYSMAIKEFSSVEGVFTVIKMSPYYDEHSLNRKNKNYETWL
jgi:hypothetical protein